MAYLLELSALFATRKYGKYKATFHMSFPRGAILPTPRQCGGDEAETDTGAPRWSWAWLVKRVCALEMVRCSFCQWGRCGSSPPSRLRRDKARYRRHVSSSPAFRTGLATFIASGSTPLDQSWSLLCGVQCRVPVGFPGGLHLLDF